MKMELSQASDARQNDPCEICLLPVWDPWILAVAHGGTESRLYGHHGCLADVQKVRAHGTMEEHAT